MTLRVQVLLEFRVVRAEEVFKELMSFVLENLGFFSSMRVVHNSNNRFINLKYLRHLSKLLTSRYSLNLKTVKICVSQDLLTVNVEETHFVSSHNSQTALNFPVLSGDSLKLRKELLADSRPTFGFLICYLVELISSIIREIVHVLSFFFHKLLTTKPISSLAE